MTKDDAKVIERLRTKNASMGRELESLRHQLSVARTEVYAMRAAAGKRAPMPYTAARKIAHRFASSDCELLDLVRDVEAYHEITEVCETKESHDGNA